MLLGIVRSKRRMVVLKDDGSRFCKQTIGLVLLSKFHYIIHCFPGELSQEQHQVLTAVQKLIQRQFRGETKPSKHLFRPSLRSDVPICK